MGAMKGSSDHARESSTRPGGVDSSQMFEDSPEGFIARWQRHAADVELFPHREGSPLLECRAGTAILQLFERTGPYLSRPGLQRAILHPLTRELRRLAPDEEERGLVPTGISALDVVGEVRALEGSMVVVDAGAPLVVGVLGSLPDGLAVGDLVRFEADAPIHGFVVTSGSQFHATPRREHIEDSI